ncbi:MAG: PKD domain-containing protein, partial [Flavobacteriales bacterium]|nr:PKD domain-containing protein [Flavobacteriales bacterium]
MARSLPILVPVLALALPLSTMGQAFNITQGSGTSCSGLIEDSGGPAAEYGDNESYTFTICPDQPGNVIYLNWVIFELSTQGPNPDNLAIYDGDNTSATFMGSYTGNQLQGLIVSGTVFNTSGCLTLVFTSNGSGTGNFAAGFQCTVPCANPTAVASMDGPVPNLICQGATVSFDGTASTAQDGYTITEYLWDFDDGTTDNSGPVVSHTFAEPGEYVVQLFVTDDNGCSNLNLVDLQILVSTTPTYNITVDEEQYCSGAVVTVTGQYQPTTWTGIPDANFGDGVYLPDNVGIPFTSTMTFTQFDPGQTVTSTDDIITVCVEMEHSFMGDLVLQIICPNGQNTILHQQGGGGTYLGGAYDLDNDANPIPGECWEYCWSPTATNGTWVQEAQAGNTTVAGTPPNGALNPGIYSSVQPLSNLVGCPLNGDWTYQSTDLWGIDNGHICSWSINFNPQIIPDVTQYTPSIGAGSDSSYWQSPVPPDNVSANGDTITFTVTTPGPNEFIYNVIDDFGCSYDTTIVIFVNEPFLVEAGDDVTVCDGPVQLEATINGQAGICTWTLEMEDSWGDGWNGAQLTVNIDGVANTYSAMGTGTTVDLTVPM